MGLYNLEHIRCVWYNLPLENMLIVDFFQGRGTKQVRLEEYMNSYSRLELARQKHHYLVVPYLVKCGVLIMSSVHWTEAKSKSDIQQLILSMQQ